MIAHSQPSEKCAAALTKVAPDDIIRLYIRLERRIKAVPELDGKIAEDIARRARDEGNEYHS